MPLRISTVSMCVQKGSMLDGTHILLLGPFKSCLSSFKIPYLVNSCYPLVDFEKGTVAPTIPT